MSSHYYQEDIDFVKGLIDDKCDPALGHSVAAHLALRGVETPFQKRDASGGDLGAGNHFYQPVQAFNALEKGVHAAYSHLGLDNENDSLQDTPKRFAKMFVGELTKGLCYDFFPKCTATEVVGHNEMVLVRNITTVSLCEHHLQTIDGVTHIAYIPNRKLIGLSKLARVTEFFAARPQVQERMTNQIFHALEFILDTPDVAVVQDAVHFCMRARGVKQPSSSTQTNKLGGLFMSNEALRKEFLDAIAK